MYPNINSNPQGQFGQGFNNGPTGQGFNNGPPQGFNQGQGFVPS